MNQYRCQDCGYLYDPKLGDPTLGVSPGTSFQEVPWYWCCPKCHADKRVFVKLP